MPNIISVPEPRADIFSLVQAVTAVKEQLGVMVGNSGSALDKFSSLEDLVNYGLLDAVRSSDGVITDITIGTAFLPVTGYADRGVYYVKDALSVWTPSSPQDIVVTFRQKNAVIATHTVRASLNISNGNVTVTSQSTTGEGSTLSVTDNTTPTPIAAVQHDKSSMNVPLIIFSIDA
jgi:hypothetical protein